MAFPWRRRPPPTGPTVIPRQLEERRDAAPDWTAAGPRASLREAAPAQDDRWLIGAALRAYQDAHGLSEAQLAHQLGLTPERLRWLQMRTRPNPASPSFEDDVYQLAASFGCRPDALLDVLAV